MLVHPIDDRSNDIADDESYLDISNHLIVDKVIKLSSLPAIEEWNILGWVEMGIN